MHDATIQQLRYLIPLLVVQATLEPGPARAADGTQHEILPPASINARDKAWDDGETITVTFELSPDDSAPADGKANRVAYYLVERAGELNGVYENVGNPVPTKRDYKSRVMTIEAPKCEPGEPYYFRVRAMGSTGEHSEFAVTTEAALARRQWFDGGRFYLLLITLVVCGSVAYFIQVARGGRDLKIRKIAGLEAIDEAVGRATEMGRSCLFIPGIQDLNDIQTLAGITMLSRVAQVAAEYDARVEVPTCRSLVMTTARETVEAAFLSAGRPDAYNEDNIYYVTDEQFGYVAYLSGMMVREKPAACFYMGSFFAESLILAETGNSIGAIQVAGTAQPSQLPFFVAACDYTLIGEEFFAATAYLSGDPHQLGSLKGQDVGKVLVAALLLVGVGLVTLAVVTGNETVQVAADYLRDVVLKSGA